MHSRYEKQASEKADNKSLDKTPVPWNAYSTQEHMFEMTKKNAQIYAIAKTFDVNLSWEKIL